MMAGRTSDVAGYVHEVVAAFDKGVNLVRRIEDRKDGKNDPEAVRDLYKSLALGPTIVQGYFDADSKRMGVPYTIGDYEAQVQLRDVLLSLKTLIGDLSDVLLDDKALDFRQLQEASDTCRVNAGVCLGQLSQRLASPAMQFHNPPPQYMSGIPPMGSPSLHYSHSHSTHSSGSGRFPRTPDPYFQQQSLSPQWQQTPRSDMEENYYMQHRRQDTETSLQETYNANWSGTSQLFTDREVDEVSMRRPSSHCLGADDEALLSPALGSDNGAKQQVLPGQRDLTRESYTSFNMPSGAENSTRISNTNSQFARDRYGPDDYSPPPVHTGEQHGPFYPDRDSTQSVTSFASRAQENQHNGSERGDLDYRNSAQPEPLRLPLRQMRQPSNDPVNPPPRRPIPPVPFDSFTGHQPLTKHAEIPVRLPSHIHGQRIPIPPRNDSRTNSSSNSGTPQRMLSPGPTGPPYQPSVAVQRAMQHNQGRRQYELDRLPQVASLAGSHTSSQPRHAPPQPGSMSPPQVQQPPAQREQFNRAAQNQVTYPEQPIPQSTLKEPPKPMQQSSPPQTPPVSRSQQPSQPPTPLRSQTTSVKAPSVRSVPIPSNLPLTLPHDKNTQPFCKGAFRLFLGLSKKSFVQAQRPLGMASFVPYWKCDKCFFEGKMASVPGPPDKKGRPGKPEKVFDPTIRECGPISTAVIPAGERGEGAGGVRFKWAFLAKCHVPLKSMPDTNAVDTFGSFGCLFCTAEGAARGWTSNASTLSLGLNGPGLNDASSTFSGKSGNSGGGSASASTPVFGNLQLFMDHLQMHRREENWPCAEMQGRMKCVVGRVADRGEDWEINFLPL